MGKNRIFWERIVLAILALATSCAPDQNFEILKNPNALESLEGTLINLEAEEHLANQSGSPIIISKNFEIQNFFPSFNTEKAGICVLNYQIENTTSKDVNVIVVFLDRDGAYLDLESFILPTAPTGILNREVTYGTASGKNIDVIKNAVTVKVSVHNMGDRKSVSVLSEPKISFASWATLTLDSQ